MQLLTCFGRPEFTIAELARALANQQDALHRCQAAASGRATLAEWQRALADWQEAQAALVAIRQAADREVETLSGNVQSLNLI